jgi:hypothetical protein
METYRWVCLNNNVAKFMLSELMFILCNVLSCDCGPFIDFYCKESREHTEAYKYWYGSSFFHKRNGYWIILVLANKNNLCCTILRVFSLVNNLTLLVWCGINIQVYVDKPTTIGFYNFHFCYGLFCILHPIAHSIV